MPSSTSAVPVPMNTSIAPFKPNPASVPSEERNIQDTKIAPNSSRLSLVTLHTVRAAATA